MVIRYLGIRSGKFWPTLNFYRDLGLPCLTFDDTYGLLRAGATQLMIEQVDLPEDQPYYHFAFDIPRNQLENAAAWLGERVDLLQREGKTLIEFPDWNASSVYFHDPMGNIVEFIARQNLDNDAEGGFTPEMILRVSEIGWPVLSMDFPEADFQLPVWREYENFQALGSVTGLVLLVPNQRPWTPTGRPAEAAPLVLVIEDELGTRHYVRR